MFSYPLLMHGDQTADPQLLIALHVWAASSTYEALGDFGEFTLSRQRKLPKDES